MSHFTVLVIGNNPEEQLAPYHEYECTGKMDEYVKFLPAEETRKELLEEYEKSNYETFEEYLCENYGYKIINDVIGHYTNPNKKWDWYVLGGRWEGYFLLKDGTRVDQALKKDIDIQGMMDHDRKEATTLYTRLESLCGGSIPKLEKTWKDCLKEANQNYNQARSLYKDQDSVKIFDQAVSSNNDLFFLDLQDFQISKEEYGNNAANNALSTFAIVKDSKWFERGEMGWFGISTNEQDRETWNKTFMEIFDSVSDDTLISLYDCHI